MRKVWHVVRPVVDAPGRDRAGGVAQACESRTGPQPDNFERTVDEL